MKSSFCCCCLWWYLFALLLILNPFQIVVWLSGLCWSSWNTSDCFFNSEWYKWLLQILLSIGKWILKQKYHKYTTCQWRLWSSWYFDCCSIYSSPKCCCCHHSAGISLPGGIFSGSLWYKTRHLDETFDYSYQVMFWL